MFLISISPQVAGHANKKPAIPAGLAFTFLFILINQVN
ncbi:hypothetical protein C2W64_04904 [Brevibacillus laterosporus]|nr:hypothetical protein C2W64_04904 [Brevibacillus laterosporus]